MSRALGVWAVLMGLLALTVGLALLPLGGWAMPVALAIGVIKAGFVLVIFMDLGTATGLVRAFAAIGIAWMAILIGLAMTDYGIRRDALLPPSEPAARERGAQ